MARTLIGGAAFAGLVLAASALAGAACAQDNAQENSQANPPAPARLALVVGEAAYAGATLPTAANDAGLVAQTLTMQGFDVTELHDLNTADLAAGERAFIAKARSTPAGAAVVVYFGGLAVNVGCDDYLLPVGAAIRAPGDVPRVALSMTRVMADLADSGAAADVVLLDGARPIPPSVSLASFPKGLIPLTPSVGGSFGLSAEVNDFEQAQKAGDANDAYVLALTASLRQPYGDIDTTLSETRLATHQATAGAQTPWHAANAQTPPFVFPPDAGDADVQAAGAALPDAANPIGGMPGDAAYWAAIWRNSVDGYQAYLAAFAKTAAPDRVARVRSLVALLQRPIPRCVGSSTPPPRPVVSPVAPVPVITAPVCPDGFAPALGQGGEFCAPVQISTPCPPGTVAATIDGQSVCRIVNGCPPSVRPVWSRGRFVCVAPPACPPGLRTIWNGDAWVCQRPPYCRPGSAPVWSRNGFVCLPPRDCGPRGAPIWTSNGWACRPTPPPPGCRPGQRNCPPPPLSCKPGQPNCPPAPLPGCKPGQPNCPPAPLPGCKPGRPNCPPAPPLPGCKPGQPNWPPPPLPGCKPGQPNCPPGPRPPPCKPGQPGCGPRPEKPPVKPQPQPKPEKPMTPAPAKPVASQPSKPPKVDAPKPFKPAPDATAPKPKPAPAGAPAGGAPRCGAAGQPRC